MLLFGFGARKLGIALLASSVENSVKLPSFRTLEEEPSPTV
jgi:hypothetical protein